MAKYKIKTQIAARRSNYGDISATSKLPKLQLTKPNFTLHNRGDMCQILGKRTEQDTQWASESSLALIHDKMY